MKNPAEDTYSEAETVRRREAALKRMLATPRTPHAKPKAKRKAKRVKSPGRVKP